MTTPAYGPCADWCSSADLCSPVDDYSFPAGVIADSIEIASNLLFVLSGRQFPGTCSTTVRPCSRRCTESYPNYGLGMVTSCDCQSAGVCGCSELEQIELGTTPIISVTEVVVDGAVVSSSLYRVDDWRWLVRLPNADGTNRGWPGCQRLDLDSTEDETFEVTFTYGRPVPPEGVRAAAVLAGEIAASCVPEALGACTLSSRVTSITRQGVTVALDSLDSIAQDLTGLPMVDLFLKAHNPGRLRRRGRVFSPDIGPHVRRIGT